jgi:hypothetical protein
MTLYETDYYAWLHEQARLLEQGRFDALDVRQLVEELDAVRSQERREALRRLRRLVQHLLKWQYQPRRRQTGHSWRSTIRTQRAALTDMLVDSHTMGQELPALLTRGYPLARQWACDDTRLPLTTFPETCPWTLAQVLDDGFWPDAPGGEAPRPA